LPHGLFAEEIVKVVEQGQNSVLLLEMVLATKEIKVSKEQGRKLKLQHSPLFESLHVLHYVELLPSL